jgi:hypothetical protein
MPSFEPYKGFEVVDALLFDADGDKDLDLYWVTGSNEFLPNDPQLADCLFLNDGKGNLPIVQLSQLIVPVGLVPKH